MRRDPRQRSTTSKDAKQRAKWQRSVQKLNIRDPSTSGKKRWGSQILRDFGPLDCPPGTVPSPALFLEARQALGWNQPDAAWHLGFTRSRWPIVHIERHESIPNRCTILLLVHHLQALDRRQRSVSVSASLQPAAEGEKQ